jgi:hypothetical protein
MGLPALRKQVFRLESILRTRRQEDGALLGRIRDDSAQIMALAGMPPDPWQKQLLSSTAERVLLLCSRQSGKSSVAATLAVKAILLQPQAQVLLLSPSLRQSAEVYRKAVHLLDQLGRPVAVVAESAQRLELANGARVLSLPGTERTIRGFSEVALLIIDEAARVADALYYAVRPMLAVSRGRLVALSTPAGRRGWFHDAWHGGQDWERVRVTALQCPRITPAFLAQERQSSGERWFRQEYLTEFVECLDAAFSDQDIQAVLSEQIQPLFGD